MKNPKTGDVGIKGVVSLGITSVILLYAIRKNIKYNNLLKYIKTIVVCNFSIVFFVKRIFK